MTDIQSHDMAEAVFDNRIEQNTEPYLTTKELAKLISVHPDSVRRWASTIRNFPSTKLGGCTRYRLSEVVAFFNEK